MSSKIFGASCLVAGTTIGAGMLALPLTLSPLGLGGAICLMGITWFVMYVGGLYGLELNLRAGKGMTLGALGQFYSGSIARFLGDLSLVLLTYALMVAYLLGGASLIENFLKPYISIPLSFSLGGFFGVLSLILAGNLRWVDHHNRLLFLCMLAAIMVLLFGLGGHIIPLNKIPSFRPILDLSSWQMAIPVAFTSFGYHIIQNTMVEYCDYKASDLKKAFFWGSLIPLIVYISWVVLALWVLSTENPDFYHQMKSQKVELGDFINALGNTVYCSWLQPMGWFMSILAILTSAIGVGLAIMSFWDHHLTFQRRKHPMMVGLTLIPPLFFGICSPRFFIGILGVAGLILTIIALFLPLYLVHMADKKGNCPPFYRITQSKGVRVILFLMGLIVFACEMMNLLF